MIKKEHTYMKNVIIIACALSLISQLPLTINASGQRNRTCISPAKIALGLLLILPATYIANTQLPCVPCVINNLYAPAFSSTYVEQTPINHCLPCTQTTNTKLPVEQYIKENPYPKDWPVPQKKTK